MKEEITPIGSATTSNTTCASTRTLRLELESATLTDTTMAIEIETEIDTVKAPGIASTVTDRPIETWTVSQWRSTSAIGVIRASAIAIEIEIETTGMTESTIETTIETATATASIQHRAASS